MSRLFAASLVVVSAIAAVGGIATAETRDPQPPRPRQALEWMVLNEINSAYFDRTMPMDRPALVTRVPDGVIRQVDISHDGVADWLIDYENSGMMYCGTGGCQRTLYVSVPNDGSEGLGYVMAFNEQSDTFVIGKRGGETVIDMDVHQVFCNPMSEQCTYSFSWDPALHRLVERPNVRGETLLNGSFGLIGEPDVDHPKPPEGAPEVLATQWRATATACPSGSSDGEFNLVHADIFSVPDLNGDRVRDWYYSAPYPCVAADEAAPNRQSFEIYLSQADGSVVRGFTSGPGEVPAYDIATRPAMLISNPECGYGEPCRNARLKWDGGAGRFVPAR